MEGNTNGNPNGKRGNKGHSASGKAKGARTPFDYAKGLARGEEQPQCSLSRYVQRRVEQQPRLGGELVLPPAQLALLGGHFGVEVVDPTQRGRRQLRRRVAFEDASLGALAASSATPWWLAPGRRGAAVVSGSRRTHGSSDDGDDNTVGTPRRTIWITPDGRSADSVGKAPSSSSTSSSPRKQQTQQKQKQQKQQQQQQQKQAQEEKKPVEEGEGNSKKGEEKEKEKEKEAVVCEDDAVVLEVEVRPGQCERVTVSMRDNAEDVVRAFAKKHALTEAAADELLRRVFESLHHM